MKKVLLSDGKNYALVDDDDFHYVSQFIWHALPSHGITYAARHKRKSKNKYTTVRMHRDILNPPDHLQIDHINHLGLDNRRSNLRICTAYENNKNRRQFKNARSKFKGLAWMSDRQRWRCQIFVKGKRIILGEFSEEIDAANCYDFHALKHFGKDALLNFPFNTPIEIDFPSKGTSKDKTPISVSHAGVGVFLFTEAI